MKIWIQIFNSRWDKLIKQISSSNNKCLMMRIQCRGLIKTLKRVQNSQCFFELSDPFLHRFWISWWVFYAVSNHLLYLIYFLIVVDIFLCCWWRRSWSLSLDKSWMFSHFLLFMKLPWSYMSWSHFWFLLCFSWLY